MDIKTTPTDKETKNQATPDQWGRGLRFLILAIGLIMLGWALWARLDFFQQQARQWLDYPFFRAGSEGLLLSEAQIIQRGGSIYVPLEPTSFISAPYPPLYYYLLSWLWPGDGHVSQAFQTGRLISLVAAIACAVCLLLLVKVEEARRHWAGWLAGAIAGLLFLAMPAVTVWAVRVRADMLMTGFGLIALVLVAWQPHGWPVFAACVPLSLAVLTKQTALAAPAACAIFVVLQNWGRWRFVLGWLGTLAATVGLPLLIINFATGNELYRRLFKYHNLPWLGDTFGKNWSLFSSENLALLGLGLALALITLVAAIGQVRKAGGKWLNRVVQGGQVVPLSLWYWLASLPLLIGIGVAGADHNHFLPMEAANCAVGGILLARALSQAGGWKIANMQLARQWLFVPVLAVLIAQAAVFAVPARSYEIEFRNQNADYRRQMAAIIADAKNNPTKAILTSEAAFFALADKPTTYNDLFTLAALSQQGLYDKSVLLDRVRRGEFGLIIAADNFFEGGVRSDIWTPDLLDAIRSRYQLKFRDVWYVYAPK